MAKKINRYTFSDISTSSSYIVKNFVIANSDDTISDISLDHPFSFNGVVLIICRKGSDRIRINYKEYTVDESTIITILPNQVVERFDYSKDLFVDFLAFSFEFISDFVLPKDFNIPQRIANQPVLKISEEDLTNLLKYRSFIIETFNNKRYKYFEQTLKGQLFSLMTVIASLYAELGSEPKAKASSRNEEIVEQFLLLLREHHKTERTATFYADKMCLTSKYLSTTLKKVTGRSINSWIEDASVLSAKILLKSTNLTVLQISEEMNYPSSSYFGRFFKKSTGMTPVEYRES